MTMTDEKPPPLPPPLPLSIGIPETRHKAGPLTRLFERVLLLGKKKQRRRDMYPH